MDEPNYNYQHPIFQYRPYIRLAQEHEIMYEQFKRTKYISYEVAETVSPLRIPTVYHIHYRIRSIIGIEEDQRPIYGNHHIARLEISAINPTDHKARMKTDIWHPNIKSEGTLKGRICVNSEALGNNLTLASTSIRVGEMLQYKNYLAEFVYPYPEDPKVAEWVRKYAEPNGIVDRDKGIYVDDTPLLARYEEGEVPEGQSASDEPPAPEDDGGIVIKRREEPQIPKRSKLDWTQEEQSDDDDNDDNDAEEQGDDFTIRPRA